MSVIKKENMSSESTHYTTLGVPRTATQDEIRAAYHAIARAHHPDRNINATHQNRLKSEEIFKAASRAHEILTDPLQKTSYDLDLDSPFTSFFKNFTDHHHSSTQPPKSTSTKTTLPRDFFAPNASGVRATKVAKFGNDSGSVFTFNTNFAPAVDFFTKLTGMKFV